MSIEVVALMIGAVVYALEGRWLRSRSLGGNEVDGTGCGIDRRIGDGDV
jgi:hypothetical protein